MGGQRKYRAHREAVPQNLKAPQQNSEYWRLYQRLHGNPHFSCPLPKREAPLVGNLGGPGQLLPLLRTLFRRSWALCTYLHAIRDVCMFIVVPLGSGSTIDLFFMKLLTTVLELFQLFWKTRHIENPTYRYRRYLEISKRATLGL